MNKKKILSLIMALVMLVGVFSPLTAFADNANTPEDNKNISTKPDAVTNSVTLHKMLMTKENVKARKVTVNTGTKENPNMDERVIVQKDGKYYYAASNQELSTTSEPDSKYIAGFASGTPVFPGYSGLDGTKYDGQEIKGLEAYFGSQTQMPNVFFAWQVVGKETKTIKVNGEDKTVPQYIKIAADSTETLYKPAFDKDGNLELTTNIDEAFGGLTTDTGIKFDTSKLKGSFLIQEVKEKSKYQNEGKTIVSDNVIRCFKEKGTSEYIKKNRYIEVTAPILGKDDSIVGVLLVSAPTDSVLDSLEILRNKADVAALASILVILMIAVLSGMAMLKPFKRITESISAVTEGYDDDYLHENTYTETMELSEAFNKMSGRMKTLDDSRNEFVSNVSHELKTPLTSMKVLADSLLLQEDAPVELYKEFMGDMSEEIERENKIINDLLSLVKMDKTANTMNIKSENMNELIEKILKRLRPIAATRNIELVYESFRPVTAEVDEMKISLAISNLVENAIKYNKENGWVHVSLNADHKNCYIEVADSGIGIPAEAQEHIFERFYRVDKSHSREIGGTGLGLAIARSAVVMHRGAIKVFSQPSEGTTFTVRIPLNYVS